MNDPLFAPVDPALSPELPITEETREPVACRFVDFPLAEDVQRALVKMGMTTPTPIQARVMQPIIDGRDVIGKAETGTGKTIGFGAPLVGKIDTNRVAVQAIILTPTRELAQQVADVIRQLGEFRGLRVAMVVGGVHASAQIIELRAGSQVVVGTPGRVLDFLKDRTLSLVWCETVVLDEADRLLDMGFIDDIESILGHIPTDRQTLLFSATIPPEIQHLMKRYMRDPETHSTARGMATVPDIRQSYRMVGFADKFKELCAILDAAGNDTCIVFCNTRRQARDLDRLMWGHNYPARALHGDHDQDLRFKILDAFRSQEVRILVATDVASRGLDIENVGRVINFDVPIDVESYVHRIGRTGRASKLGAAITLVALKELPKWRRIVSSTRFDIVQEEPLVAGPDDGRGPLGEERRGGGRRDRGPQRSGRPDRRPAAGGGDRRRGAPAGRAPRPAGDAAGGERSGRGEGGSGRRRGGRGGDKSGSDKGARGHGEGARQRQTRDEHSQEASRVQQEGPLDNTPNSAQGGQRDRRRRRRRSRSRDRSGGAQQDKSGPRHPAGPPSSPEDSAGTGTRASGPDAQGAPAERQRFERDRSDRGRSDRSPSQRGPSQRAPSDRASADRAPSDRAPSDRAPSDREPAGRGPSDRGPGRRDRGGPRRPSRGQRPERRGPGGGTGGGREDVLFGNPLKLDRSDKVGPVPADVDLFDLSIRDFLDDKVQMADFTSDLKRVEYLPGSRDPKEDAPSSADVRARGADTERPERDRSDAGQRRRRSRRRRGDRPTSAADPGSSAPEAPSRPRGDREGRSGGEPDTAPSSASGGEGDRARRRRRRRRPPSRPPRP